ncbi:hypothetical protein APED_11735 [Acanthopleuribacter pedis]
MIDHESDEARIPEGPPSRAVRSVLGFRHTAKLNKGDRMEASGPLCLLGSVAGQVLQAVGRQTFRFNRTDRGNYRHRGRGCRDAWDV